MTFRALLYAYVLGGITFIPLLLVAVVGLGWALLPKADDAAEPSTKNGATEKVARSEDDQRAINDLLAKKHEDISEGGASGTFAVLRKYDFQAANAALMARNNATANAAAPNATGDGGTEASKESESVYQSMYRSVFDRGKGATQTSVLANEEEDAEALPGTRTKRNTTPANVFYIILRHGHLMLYDSASQMDVRHVISLAHHTLSLSEGAHSISAKEHHGIERDQMKDGELFIKRTAIVLTPVDLPNGHLQSRNAPAKPFYLFSATCSEKEDFYHSLLYTRSRPPIPEPLDPNDTIKLQSTLHSTSLTPETRALNALVGRIFLGVYHTDRAKHFVQSKVEKKISRVQKPAFIASLAVQSIDLGDSAPVLWNPRLKDLHISGDMTIACDIKYSGGINLTITAVAKLDLGTRFKTRFVDLVLATSLQRLQGHFLIRIKPPPSNRLWFCFESPPEMDIKVEPVVSQRQITYTFILRQIEDRIRAVISETLVKPNWDDVPWFDTRGQNVRGGIWRDEGSEATEANKDELPAGADILKQRNSKTKSMPILSGMNTETDSSATSSGSEATSKLASAHSRQPSDAEITLKRRSIASLPGQSGSPPNMSSERLPTAPPPLPLRSPSYSSSTPSVALDESSANIDPARNADIAPQQKKWRLGAARPQLPSRKEAVEAMREMRDKATALRETGTEVFGVDKDDESASDRPSTAEEHRVDVEQHHNSERDLTTAPDSPSSAEDSFANRSLKTSKRTGTDLSLASTTSQTTQTQQRKQTILAATAAATSAARNWSWNAYQTAKKNSPARAGNTASQPEADAQSQPMGRGQPLPPPGMPLPGPNKGLFGSFSGSVKRKPVLPPRRSTIDENGTAADGNAKANAHEPSQTEEATTSHDAAATYASSVTESQGHAEVAASDEFGPWTENSGISNDDEHKGTDSNLLGDHDDSVRVAGFHLSAGEDDAATPVPTVKMSAPPLPPRRSKEPDVKAALEDAGHTGEKVPASVYTLPPARSAVGAAAKFALGADVGEEDFENVPARDSVDQPRVDESAHQYAGINANTVGEQEKIAAIPAPVEDAEVGKNDLESNYGTDEEPTGEVKEKQSEYSDIVPQQASTDMTKVST